MPKILLVEGLTDAFFFQELLIRLYLSNPETDYDNRPSRRNIPRAVRGTLQSGAYLEVEFRNQEGRAAISDAVKTLLSTDVKEFIVAQDIDRNTPARVVESIQQIAHLYLSIGQATRPDMGVQAAFEGESFTVIPMGLENDGTLSSLGVTKHELEDYLVKLILEDPGLYNAATNLPGLLSQILPTIRAHDGPFDSSKELFQLIKPITQHGFSDTAVVRKTIQEADEGILRSVCSPILGTLESALGL